MNEDKKYKAIKAVAEKRKDKKRACIELGLSMRQVNRLIQEYQEGGKGVFSHGNRGKIAKHAVPKETKKQVIELYQSFKIKPNVKHFTEILKEDHDICYTDTTIRRILYQAHILSPKTQRKTRKKIKARIKAKSMKGKKEVENPLVPRAEDQMELPEKSHPSRPRKKYQGELIQMDASSYNWFGKDVAHLYLAIDDASGNIVGAYFDTQETLKGYYHVLNQILTKQGIPLAFLTDKRTVFEYTSKAMRAVEEDTFTQFGFACHQLGIEVNTTSIPQAKGRVERLNGTVQSRLPVDLELAGIQSMEEANHFLIKWVRTFNKKFGNKTKESIYENTPTKSEINLLLARVANRKVDSGHHIRYQNNYYLPTEGSEDRYFTRRSKVLIIEAFNGNIYVNIAEKIYTTRRLKEHDYYSQEFDSIPEQKKERRQYIPLQSHPWKLESFKRYLRSVEKTLEEYEAEQTA
ncbi:Homeodomain-like domain-containing protein [Carnobacterium iners]|uniref:Homeodomain-like domain-containing protein n=1 Tax=Carnobacterium iners TaxID=1073423 RepID=A0A1X7MS27_9LACT|nr:ISNCY family transposase [Carnobacterium iners]SMH27632.1 Homeodomain-like domain-containing protein [Carnobacterium iners]